MNNQKNIGHLRHSLAHLLAAAVKEIYPEAKLAIGPAIEDGFYYDFDFSSPISENDLPAIEKKMRELLPSWETFERIESTTEEAREIYKDNPYKLEIIEEIVAKNNPITLYYSGSKNNVPKKQNLKSEILNLKTGFVDLCRGGHIENPAKDIDPESFKLDRIAGAYWRGDEKNKMLTRIYGLAFASKEKFNEYLEKREEAKKRDHRKLGQELDLFSFHKVSPGAPFWHPRGMILFKELERLIREETERRGYKEVSTPILVKKELWERSGHWEHYKENMFLVNEDEGTYSLKPMNCPESTIIYSSKIRSYRDLPIRLAEIGRLHRNEIRGALGGLLRVRQITMDDAHIYCRPDQIEEEIMNLIDFVKDFYLIFGLTVNYKLATKPDDAMGDPSLWEKAEEALAKSLKNHNTDYELKEKDGAFYGPKIDVHISDALGRDWQLATIQLDFQMPERFKLEYMDENGTVKRPVMIHRAIFGSFERFIGIIIEHFAGAFPVWLSPVQVSVLPVSEKFAAYTNKVFEIIRESGIRVEISDSDETLGKRIREAEIQKVPYILVVGEKEESSQGVNVRSRSTGKEEFMKIDEFVGKIKEEIETRSL